MQHRSTPRELALWALSALGESDECLSQELAPVAGDASNRRYYRLTLPSRSYVVAEAPPATEKNESFILVRELLADAGLKVPTIFAVDLKRGLFLLEDLGDDLLFAVLKDDSVDSYYRLAFGMLEKMAVLDVDQCALAEYDRPLLVEELSRFSVWFVQELLGHTLCAHEQELLNNAEELLIGSALEQPRVVVHRDFHSRNLMLFGDDRLSLIDFQDAVVGPCTYDLVSLLRDCYIQWPAGQVRNWALVYRDRLITAGLISEVDEAQFLRWFDWMGLQRHIKVLGTFARLYLRDGKSSYLKDLPLVIQYVVDILDDYAREEPVLAAFRDWFSDCLSPLIAQHEWSEQT